MTVENCRKLAEHHRKKGDEYAAMMYEERADRKEKKYTREYLLKEAARLQEAGKGALAQTYLEKAYGKKEKKPEEEVEEEVKEDV